MSSKTLVLVAFGVWSFVCWRWYVCGIKQQCGEQRQEMASAIQSASGIETDTVAATPSPSPAFQPVEETPAKTSPVVTTKSEPDISRVQVEELQDHVAIHFPYNSTRKEDNEAIDEYLTRLAAQLKNQGGKVTLTGHTDNVGDSKTNELFAMRRAKNIRDLLVAKGVKKNQIITKSSGERKPVATNDNPRGRYKNRRVEIRVQ